MRIHDLDCWPEHFQPLSDGSKTCVVRPDDRGYAVGDVLRLNCLRHNQRGAARNPYVDPLYLKVTHKLSGGEFGIEPGYCILSVDELARGDEHMDRFMRYCVMPPALVKAWIEFKDERCAK